MYKIIIGVLQESICILNSYSTHMGHILLTMFYWHHQIFMLFFPSILCGNFSISQWSLRWKKVIEIFNLYYFLNKFYGITLISGIIKMNPIYTTKVYVEIALFRGPGNSNRNDSETQSTTYSGQVYLVPFSSQRELFWNYQKY